MKPATLTNQRVKVLIVSGSLGEGGAERQVAERSLQQYVRFIGFRADVRRWIPAFDIGVLPSLSEALSIALLEVMGSGKPVIATNVGSTSEIVTNEQTGLLVAPGDVEGLAQAIIRLAADKEYRERIAKAGAVSTREEFCIYPNITKLRKLYARYGRSLSGKSDPRQSEPAAC